MMILFNTITWQEGTIIPIPKEFKKVHLPFLESNCVAFKEGMIFQQNWKNVYQSDEICFIHAHIYEPVTFIITALNPPITVAIYCYQGGFEIREKQQFKKEPLFNYLQPQNALNKTNDCVNF